MVGGRTTATVGLVVKPVPAWPAHFWGCLRTRPFMDGERAAGRVVYAAFFSPGVFVTGRLGRVTFGAVRRQDSYWRSAAI